MNKNEYLLLANPYHIKLKEEETKNKNLDKDIIKIINLKYKDSLITLKDEHEILKKIESLYIEYTIKNTVKEKIDNIISLIVIDTINARLL